MKTLVTMAMVAGMALSGVGQAVLTDIVTYEASVIDDASGQVLVSAGPWVWQDLIPQELAGDIGGSGRTIVVKCRNDASQTIFGGTISGMDLFPPFDPFGPPPLPGALSLVFVPDAYTVAIFLNGQMFIGEMLMLPAEDDPVGPVVKTVTLDIKPGSVKNPFNMDAEGRLPVAIMGSAELDVSLIDPSSIKLATLAPVHYAITDIQSDGYADVVVLFRDKDVADLLPAVVDGEVVGLELTGALKDGTLITGSDSITVQVKKDRKHENHEKQDKDKDRDQKKDGVKGRK
jgi:hypothetical protein